MSPRIDNGQLNRTQLEAAFKASPTKTDRINMLKVAGEKNLLADDAKAWLKNKHPDLFLTFAAFDQTSATPPAANPNPWANYPAGTRYAVINKNEL